MRTCAKGKRYCNGSSGVDKTSQCQYVLMATVDEWESSYFLGLYLQSVSVSTFDDLKSHRI